MSPVAEKQHAHELIEQMAPAQVSLIVELLEDLLDPLSIQLANAAFDDEPVTEHDRLVIARSNAAAGLSTTDIMADFGLTAEDFQRMAQPSVASSLLRG